MTVDRDSDIEIDTQSQQADQIRMAAEYGIDLPALAANLDRSCSERILRHQIALNTVMKLRKVRKM